MSPGPGFLTPGIDVGFAVTTQYGRDTGKAPKSEASGCQVNLSEVKE